MKDEDIEQIGNEPQEWLDKYLDRKLNKSSSVYQIALKSYNFVFKKGIEFGMKAVRDKYEQKIQLIHLMNSEEINEKQLIRVLKRIKSKVEDNANQTALILLEELISKGKN